MVRDDGFGDEFNQRLGRECYNPRVLKQSKSKNEREVLFLLWCCGRRGKWKGRKTCLEAIK